MPAYLSRFSARFFRGMKPVPVLCTLVSLFLITLPGSAKEICPTGKEIMTSSLPYGHFAKSIWKMNRAKFNMRALHSSIFIFSKEKINKDNMELEGYIWWKRGGKLADCSRFEGQYLIAENRFELVLVEGAAKDIPIGTHLTASLGKDGLSMAGKMKVLKRSVNDNPETALAAAGATNVWANTSQSQSGSWKASKVFPLAEDKQ